MNFASEITVWYRRNQRKLPWRNTQDPYRIWLSEIIMQQTRVEQGLNYYNKFVETFPTVADLANAHDDVVMKLWQGLGYYSRARNLHYTAKQIVKNYGGIFPNEFKEIRALKGIGDYTASAIASFAFNKPYAVVDGNVMRVITRIFGITEPIDKSNARKKINKIAEELLPHENPGLYNQAIMEFGAIQCKPANPLCEECCMNKICFAFENKMVSGIPFKTKKNAAKKRHLNYLIISLHKGKAIYLYINKRTGNDIWKNLYDFPSIETNEMQEPAVLIQSRQWKSIFNNKKYVITKVSDIFKHQLTHQTIYARFYEISIKSPLTIHDPKIILVDENDLKEYAIPRLIDKYLQLR